MAEKPETEFLEHSELPLPASSADPGTSTSHITVNSEIGDNHPLDWDSEEDFRQVHRRIRLWELEMVRDFRLHNFDIDDEEDEEDFSSEEVNQFWFTTEPLVELVCEVCMVVVKVRRRACCDEVICDECTVEYFTQKINGGLVHFTCPSFGCNQPVARDEIIARVTDDQLLEKYHRFVTNANADPNKKTCPNCCAVVTMVIESFDKYGHEVICKECSFEWCFECQSPRHDGSKCKDNVKGVKALKAWTKTNCNGQRNARKCPKCKLLIQRSGGCDHMKCTRCKTHFCYACGGRQLRARFLFGNHYERLSVLGCPRNFMGGRRKHLRRFVRGSIFSGKLLVSVVGSAVLLGLLPVALVAALFAGPAIGFVRLHRYLQMKKTRKLVRRARSMREHGTNGVKPGNGLNSLTPRRDLDDSEIDMEDLMRMMLTYDFPGPTAPTASAESSSISEPDSPLPTRYAHSSATLNQDMLVAEKDEVTSL